MSKKGREAISRAQKARHRKKKAPLEIEKVVAGAIETDNPFGLLSDLSNKIQNVTISTEFADISIRPKKK